MSFLKHNWFLKLLSLAAAVVLAIYVRRPEDMTSSMVELPLTLTAPAGLKLAAPPAGQQVRVQLEGPAALVQEITAADVQVSVDLTHIRPGKQTPVGIAVELPEKFRRVMASWRPRTVQVLLVADATRQLSVVPRPMSQPDGWQWREPPRSNPARVSVTGSTRVVARVDQIVAPFSVEESERVSSLAVLEALDKQGNPITEDLNIEPSVAQITGLQERVVREKRVPVQPLFQLPEGIRVSVTSVSPSRVRLVGPDRVVSEIYVVETEPIDVPLGQTEVTRDVALVSPNDQVEMTPRRVRVTLRLEPLPVKPAPPVEPETPARAKPPDR